MPIRRLLQGSKLDADEMEILTRAFNHALHSLSLIDRRDDPLAGLVARRLLRSAPLLFAIRQRYPRWPSNNLDYLLNRLA